MDPEFSLQLPESILHRLSTLVKASGRDASFHVSRALEAYFEDDADLQIANQRLHSNDPEIRLNDVLLEICRS